jgi:hypothetical protein
VPACLAVFRQDLGGILFREEYLDGFDDKKLESIVLDLLSLT